VLCAAIIIIFYIFILATYNPGEFKHWRKKNKIGYDHQSVQSVAGKLSCKRTALKRCTKIEILWYRKLVSRTSPEFSEILLPRSSRRWRADALNTPRSVSQLAQKCIITIVIVQSAVAHRTRKTSIVHTSVAHKSTATWYCCCTRLSCFMTHVDFFTLKRSPVISFYIVLCSVSTHNACFGYCLADHNVTWPPFTLLLLFQFVASFISCQYYVS